MDRLDRVVAIRGGKLGADVADVAVDGAVRHLDIELIGGGHDLLAVGHRSRPGQKSAKDSEFDSSEGKRGACESPHMLLGIDREPALRQRYRRDLVARARCCATQDDVDARDQLPGAERFCDVIVATDLEPKNAVDLIVPCRKKQNRNVGGFADLPADVETIEFRHSDIEHDEIGTISGETGQRLLAVARLERGHAGFLEGDANDFADMQVIVNDEDTVRQTFLRWIVLSLLEKYSSLDRSFAVPASFDAPCAPGRRGLPLPCYKAMAAGNKARFHHA